MKISTACGNISNHRKRQVTEKQQDDEMNRIFNSSELFLRTEVLQESKKPKLDNSSLSTSVVILTAPGLTVGAPYSKVFDLCQNYLNHIGFSYSSSPSKKHFPTLLQTPLNNSLYTKNNNAKLSQASGSGDNKHMVVYNSSTIGRDSGKRLPNVVANESDWRHAINFSSSCFFSTKSIDSSKLNGVLMDVVVPYRIEKQEKPPKDVAKSILDVLPFLLKVHLKSKCTLFENNYVTSDSSTYDTFTMFVNISSVNSGSCKLDTFRSMVLDHYLTTSSDENIRMQICKYAKFYRVKGIKSKQIEGNAITSSEMLVSAIIACPRTWITDKSHTSDGTIAEIYLSFGTTDFELKPQSSSWVDTDSILEKKRTKQYADYCDEFNTYFEDDGKVYAGYHSVANIFRPRTFGRVDNSLSNCSQDIDFDNTAAFKPKENPTDQAKILKYIEKWLLMLNSDQTSCFYHGLTDNHAHSWTTFLKSTNAFSMAIVHVNLPSVEDMASENSLKAKGLLMPFDKEEYNKTWNGIVPCRDKFSHGKASRFVYFSHGAKDAKDAKVRSSGGGENNGLSKIAEVLENLAGQRQLTSGHFAVAQQQQQQLMVKFTRIYSASHCNNVIPNYEMSCQITDSKKSLYTLLDEHETNVDVADRFWVRFWNIGDYILTNRGKTWDFDFTVKLKNSQSFHLNLSQIKILKVSEILNDANVDLLLSITLQVIEIKVLTGSALPRQALDDENV